jgi:hypothetical protein
MKHSFQKYATGKNVFFLFVLTVIFNVFLFPRLLPAGPDILDIRFYYSTNLAYQVLENFGSSGRSLYMVNQLTLDMLYPLVYGTLFCFILFRLYRNYMLTFTPLLIVMADFMENIGIVSMLYHFPVQMKTLAHITSMFTTIKWVLVFLTATLIIIGLICKWYMKKNEVNSVIRVCKNRNK